MTRKAVLLAGIIPLAMGIVPTAARAGQDLQDRSVDAPPPAEMASPAGKDEILFSADTAEYDSESEVVTVDGDVRLFRDGNRLRADKVVWNRKTGEVVATGNIAVTNPEGDTAYGDRIELTDSLKDGAIDNMLVVLEQGGRLAAEKGRRLEDGVIAVDQAAYTPCAVLDSGNCPKEPSWKITAVRVSMIPRNSASATPARRFHCSASRHFPCPSSPIRWVAITPAACWHPTSGTTRSTALRSPSPIISTSRPIAI